MPNLIAYDIAGVQPMSGPTGLIFAMRSRYAPARDQAGAEALFNEADTAFSSSSNNAGTSAPKAGTQTGSDPSDLLGSGDDSEYDYAGGMTTAKLKLWVMRMQTFCRDGIQHREDNGYCCFSCY